jgi:hypothetical protein
LRASDLSSSSRNNYKGIFFMKSSSGGIFNCVQYADSIHDKT